jgi:valyl-tRNA synthetase
MIFSGLEHMNEKPFSTIFIHGLVRDAKGRKMSKSLGNGIDPLEIIDKFGADALRFALATGNSPGNDMRFSDEKIESARNFNNKIWNAARFVLMKLDEDTEFGLPEISALATEDKWIISRFNRLTKEVTENLDKFELGVALAKLYDFVWEVFCDWYIELVKQRLGDGDKTAMRVIAYVFSETMKLLHPYMPFITEEVWQTLPHVGESIVISEWPKYDESLDFPNDEAAIERIITAIRAIRNRRAEMNVPPSKKAKLTVVTTDRETFNDKCGAFFEKLASASEVTVTDSYESEGDIQIVTASATLYIPLSDVVDSEKEIARLTKEKEKLISEIERIEKKLSNEGFVAKAPAAVIEGEKEKLNKYKDMLTATENALKQFI